MTILDDLEKTRSEIRLALSELDKMEESLSQYNPYGKSNRQELSEQLSDRERKNIQLTEEMAVLNKSNQLLSTTNKSLTKNILITKYEKEDLLQKLTEANHASSKFQVSSDRGKDENDTLHKTIKILQDENMTMTQILDIITTENEELKKSIEKQKCPKDDKITALRSTAKALEAENNLLHEEKLLIFRDNNQIQINLNAKLRGKEDENVSLKDQIGAYKDEKESFLERLKRLENEKINVVTQLTKVEVDLNAAKLQVKKVSREMQDICEKKIGVDESLIALKDCKRVVEVQYQNVLVDKNSLLNKIEILTQENELLQVKNCSLEERLRVLEHDKHEQIVICAEIQQNLIQKTSEHESQIRSMQLELDSRLDEINASKNKDVAKVKSNYFGLFEEKASEVLNLRSVLELKDEELKKSKDQCADLEYREQELNDLVNKMRCDTQNKAHEDMQVSLELHQNKTLQLEQKLDVVKANFDKMKVEETKRIQEFSLKVEKLNSILKEKDLEILQMCDKLNMHQNFLFSNEVDIENDLDDGLSKAEQVPDCPLKSEEIIKDKGDRISKRKRRRKKR